jgi:hypothetical protein
LRHDRHSVRHSAVHRVLERDSGVSIPLAPDLAEEFEPYFLARPDGTQHILADRVVDPGNNRPGAALATTAGKPAQLLDERGRRSNEVCAEQASPDQ